jgi:hypothetical protein
MANSKISALTSATTPLAGTETLPIVQGGATVKATVANITGAGAYAGAFTTLSATGVTTVQAGTALLPAITTSGDTNTGIFFPAADTIAFSEGGVEAMRLNANGQLNVGNTSTAFDSTAYAIVGSGTGDSGLVIYTSNATAGYLQFADGTSGAEEYRGFIKYDHSTNAMSFSTNSTARTEAEMTIDSAGNAQFQTGAVMPYAPAPAAISGAATLTNANIQAQIISATGTTYTITMPLGTTLETLATWATTGIAYDFYVINTASGTITLDATEVGVTSVGTMTIATGVSAQFRIRRTAANTFVVYRLG